MHTVEPRYDKPLYKEAELAISTKDRQNHVSAAFLSEDGCFYCTRSRNHKVLIKSQKNISHKISMKMMCFHNDDVFSTLQRTTRFKVCFS